MRRVSIKALKANLNCVNCVADFPKDQRAGCFDMYGFCPVFVLDSEHIRYPKEAKPDSLKALLRREQDKGKVYGCFC